MTKSTSVQLKKMPVRIGIVVVCVAIAALTFVKPFSVQEVNSDGVYGILYTPRWSATKESVVLLGGSEGGASAMLGLARKLAIEGHPALSLAYFKYKDLPQSLSEIPLEYGSRAAQWLVKQPFSTGQHVAVVGTSRGAEYALLLASHFPVIDRVVAISPSSVSWPGFRDGIIGGPAWTLRNCAIPFVDVPVDGSNVAQDSDEASRALAILRSISQDNKARIPIENSAASVLLLAGSADRLWPTEYMAKELYLRLKAKKAKPRCDITIYEGAGHMITPGSDPNLVRLKQKFMGQPILLGGNFLANKRAQDQSWLSIKTFLNREEKADGDFGK